MTAMTRRTTINAPPLLLAGWGGSMGRAEVSGVVVT
jgi:hypothetical protein